MTSVSWTSSMIRPRLKLCCVLLCCALLMTFHLGSQLSTYQAQDPAGTEPAGKNALHLLFTEGTFYQGNMVRQTVDGVSSVYKQNDQGIIEALAVGGLNHDHTIPEPDDIIIGLSRLHKEGKKVEAAPSLNDYDILYNDQLSDLFTLWNVRTMSACGGQFVGHNNQFAVLSDVVVDPVLFTGERAGGEPLNEVIGQSEDVEYFNISKGAFQITCTTDTPAYQFGENSHLNAYMQALETRRPENQAFADGKIEERLTIAVTRKEYANLYHSMTEWYNIYLTMRYLKLHAQDVLVLLVDAHPRSPMDDAWATLFDSVTRISQLQGTRRFRKLVWAMQGYDSPMLKSAHSSLPFVEHFRDFFLHRFNIGNPKVLNCSCIKAVLLLRKSYLSHPRQNGKHATRQINNPTGMVRFINASYKDIHLQTVHFETMDMRAQLDIIMSTDIIMAMHGAALTHILFLPPHAAVLEFFPNYMPMAFPNFQAMARWRGLWYQNWHNISPEYEHPHHLTDIPVHVVRKMLDRLLKQMCRQPRENSD